MVSALEAFHCITLYTIALKRSRNDAELKLLIPALDFLKQYYKVTVEGREQVALAYVSALHRGAHSSLSLPGTASSGKLVVAIVCIDAVTEGYMRSRY